MAIANEELTPADMRNELARTRALATIAENAGEAQTVDLCRSIERALLFGLMQAGEKPE